MRSLFSHGGHSIATQTFWMKVQKLTITSWWHIDMYDISMTKDHLHSVCFVMISDDEFAHARWRQGVCVRWRRMPRRRRPDALRLSRSTAAAAAACSTRDARPAFSREEHAWCTPRRETPRRKRRRTPTAPRTRRKSHAHTRDTCNN